MTPETLTQDQYHTVKKGDTITRINAEGDYLSIITIRVDSIKGPDEDPGFYTFFSKEGYPLTLELGDLNYDFATDVTIVRGDNS